MDAQSAIVVPRDKIFVLRDGTFVVQWEANQVQNLVNGKYLSFDDSQYGYAITDYELGQLKNIGVVAQYDVEQVFLSPHKDLGAQKQYKRSYYLNTTLPKTRLSQVEAALIEVHLDGNFSLRIRDDFVVLWARNGLAFTHFEDAEKARDMLVNLLPNLLDRTVVAFVEVLSAG